MNNELLHAIEIKFFFSNITFVGHICGSDIKCINLIQFIPMYVFTLCKVNSDRPF